MKYVLAFAILTGVSQAQTPRYQDWVLEQHQAMLIGAPQTDYDDWVLQKTLESDMAKKGVAKPTPTPARLTRTKKPHYVHQDWGFPQEQMQGPVRTPGQSYWGVDQRILDEANARRQKTEQRIQRDQTYQANRDHNRLLEQQKRPPLTEYYRDRTGNVLPKFLLPSNSYERGYTSIGSYGPSRPYVGPAPPVKTKR